MAGLSHGVVLPWLPGQAWKHAREGERWPLFPLVGCSRPPARPMPAVSQTLMIVAAVVGVLAAWAGVGVTVLVFLWNQQNKRIDHLREDVKELRAEHRADNKVLNEKVDHLRDEVKGLPLKIMEMLRKAPH